MDLCGVHLISHHLWLLPHPLSPICIACIADKIEHSVIHLNGMALKIQDMFHIKYQFFRIRAICMSVCARVFERAVWVCRLCGRLLSLPSADSDNGPRFFGKLQYLLFVWNSGVFVLSNDLTRLPYCGWSRDFNE